MARTKVILDTGKMQKMIGDALKTVCKTSDNRKRIDEALKDGSRELSASFEAHKITQEIAAGPKGQNTSGTLGGYGNLFSFIGFPEGDEPLKAIREIIKQKIFHVRTVNGVFKRGNVVTMIVDGPTAEDIFDTAKTPMPWAKERSWARGIETGISGLGQYMHMEYRRGKWRSGMGFQAGDDVEPRPEGVSLPSKFQNTSYITKLIAQATKAAIRSATSRGVLK